MQTEKLGGQKDSDDICCVSFLSEDFFLPECC